MLWLEGTVAWLLDESVCTKQVLQAILLAYTKCIMTSAVDTRKKAMPL